MIAATSQAIAQMIESATPEYGAWVDVGGLSAADPAPAPGKLTIALYSIESKPMARQIPVVGRPGALSSTLRYLVVYGGDHLEAQNRLERVALAIDNHPVIAGIELGASLQGSVDRIALRFRSTTDEDRFHIWAALGRPQMLGLYYDADVSAAVPRQGVV